MSEARINLLQQSTASVTDEEILDLYSVPDRATPWLRVNFISSVDGAATANGLSGGLGTPADRRVFDLLRRLCDVVIVGAGTVRTEGYGPMRLDNASVEWRIQQGLSPHPVFAIVSSSLDLDPGSAIFRDAPTRPIVMTSHNAAESRRLQLADVADVVVAGPSSVDTTLMRQVLIDRGLSQMHCEGGLRLFGDLIRDNTVDELCLTVRSVLEGPGAPRIVSGPPVDAQRPFDIAHALSADDTLLLRYVRKAPALS
jgi:riboflavin biosynthesis pyrimidine reductase